MVEVVIASVVEGQEPWSRYRQERDFFEIDFSSRTPAHHIGSYLADRLLVLELQSGHHGESHYCIDTTCVLRLRLVSQLFSSGTSTKRTHTCNSSQRDDIQVQKRSQTRQQPPLMFPLAPDFYSTPLRQQQPFSKGPCRTSPSPSSCTS